MSFMVLFDLFYLFVIIEKMLNLFVELFIFEVIIWCIIIDEKVNVM